MPLLQRKVLAAVQTSLSCEFAVGYWGIHLELLKEDYHQKIVLLRSGEKME